MEKAWELKALMEELKAKGLDLAEDAAKHSVEAFFNWVEKSVELSDNKIDDLAKPFIPQIKAAALGALDKIDGQEG